MDKGFAIVACLPIGYALYVRLGHGALDFVEINLLIQGLLNIVPMLVRRTPVRVTLNPLYWLLAFVAAYWVPFPALDTSPGTPIAPVWICVLLSFLGLLLAVFARLSLGRNIGVVPAQRRLVTSGAYGWVRHPIYSAIFVNYLALILQHYSSLHLLLVGLGTFWFVLKSIVEERFLAQDPEYAQYMRRVRRRWIPGLV